MPSIPGAMSHILDENKPNDIDYVNGTHIFLRDNAIIVSHKFPQGNSYSTQSLEKQAKSAY